MKTASNVVAEAFEKMDVARDERTRVVAAGAERVRCARIVARFIEGAPPGARRILEAIETEIRKPAKSRKRRLYTCGICGADDHTAKTHDRASAPPSP